MVLDHPTDRVRSAGPSLDEVGSDEPALDPDPDDGKERSGRRWVLPAAAIGLTVLTVLVLGALLGYRFATSRVATPKAGDTVVLEGADAGELEESSAAMPDLGGLDREEAIEALTDAGIDTSILEESTQPYVGAAGRVIAQQPPRGTADPERVAIVISTAAEVPALVGKPAADAVDQLEALGVVVRQDATYRPGTTPGTVLATEPAAGKAPTETMTVSVSAKASSVFLSSITPSESRCDATSDATVGTIAVQNSLLCDAVRISDGEADAAAVYALSGRADRFEATVGISNEEDPATTARIVVRVDGEVRFDQVVTFNAPVVATVELTGAAQLVLTASEPFEDTDDWEGAAVVFANPTLYGSPDGIDALQEGS